MAIGAPQQHAVEHAALQREDALPAGAHVADFLDRVDDVAVEEREVLQRRVAAVQARAVLGIEAVLAALAVAARGLAEVVAAREMCMRDAWEM